MRNHMTFQVLTMTPIDHGIMAPHPLEGHRHRVPLPRPLPTRAAGRPPSNLYAEGAAGVPIRGGRGL